MSNVTVHNVRELVGKTVVEAAWAQWMTLTSGAVPAHRRRAWSIVDPEALVLVSMAFGDRERRLYDLTAAWGRDAAFLMSLQRMRSLSAAYPKSMQSGLNVFAHYAAEAGDRKWHKLAAVNEHEYRPRKKSLGKLSLAEGPALVLRLRAGLGVSAKADVLGLLLGLNRAASFSVIAAATGYTDRAVRTATEDMVLAGFVHEIQGRPSTFYADPDAWNQVLQTYNLNSANPQLQLPKWRFWAAVFVFLAAVREWADAAEEKNWSSYVAGSRARDLFEEHEPRLQQAQVGLLPVQSATPEYLDAFESSVRTVCTWTLENL